MPPKASYKVIRETSKPSSTWYPNAERYSYEDVIGTYPTFKAAKSVAETNLSEEWEENVSFWVKSVEEKKDYYEMKATFQEGEAMRVYTVKEQVEKEDPSGTKTAKAPSSAKAKQTAKKPQTQTEAKAKAKSTGKSGSTSKTSVIGRQTSTRTKQTAKRGGKTRR